MTNSSLFRCRHEKHDCLVTRWSHTRPIAFHRDPTEERRRLGNQTRRKQAGGARDRTVSEAQEITVPPYRENRGVSTRVASPVP